MAKRGNNNGHDEHAEQAERVRQQPPVRWWRRLLRGMAVFVLCCLLLLTAVIMIPGVMYRGPRALEQVPAVMPGVPIFPYAQMARGNRLAQFLMAIPLLLLRQQGAKGVETVTLAAPADQDFVLEWYYQATRSMQWTLLGRTVQEGQVRLVFQRGQEGLQLLIGPTRGIETTVQYLYMEGMTARQLAQLTPAVKPAIPAPVLIPPQPPDPEPLPPATDTVEDATPDGTDSTAAPEPATPGAAPNPERTHQVQQPAQSQHRLPPRVEPARRPHARTERAPARRHAPSAQPAPRRRHAPSAQPAPSPEPAPPAPAAPPPKPSIEKKAPPADGGM